MDLPDCRRQRLDRRGAAAGQARRQKGFQDSRFQVPRIAVVDAKQYPDSGQVPTEAIAISSI
jgi:hypothetical protein